MEALPKDRKSSLVPRPILFPSPTPSAANLSHLPCQEAGGNRATPGCPHLTSTTVLLQSSNNIHALQMGFGALSCWPHQERDPGSHQPETQEAKLLGVWRRVSDLQGDILAILVTFLPQGESLPFHPPFHPGSRLLLELWTWGLLVDVGKER